MTYRRRRWSDDEKHWKMFVWAPQTRSKSWGIILDSGDEEYPGSTIRLQGFGWTLIIETPGLIKPYREKVIAKSWSAADIERMGRNWYEKIYAREYGISLSENAIHTYYGKQTWDSSTTQSSVYFLPWTETRHVRTTFYDKFGHVFNEIKNNDRINFDLMYKMKNTNQPVIFEFADYDGELIQVKTVMEECEYEYGIGYFKWISWFRKSCIYRTLDLQFLKEVGREKGSWKGGILGHGIEMNKDELHETAFKRYCNEHGLKFIRRCDANE